LNTAESIKNNGNCDYPELRDLARQIQEETDTNKMIELVQQLIAKFDDKQMRKAMPRSSESKSA
jgi:hypothetical protein